MESLVLYTWIHCGSPLVSVLQIDASLGSVEIDVNLWIDQALKLDFLGWNSSVCKRGNGSQEG